jgi:hypothetical protein
MADSHCRKGTLLISPTRNNGNATEPNNSLYKVGTEVAGYIQATTIFMNKPMTNYNVVNIIIYDTNI